MAADVQNVKVVDPSRTWLGQRAKRTEAIPKHSLSGAGLEIFKPEERDEVSKIDVKQVQDEVEKQRRIKQDRYKRTLPDYLKKRGPLDDEYQKSKEELVNQIQETTHAKHMLDALETSSKYFGVGCYEGRKSKSPDKSPSWYGREDLAHSKDINIVGLPNPANYTSNYNHDKYGKCKPSHSYSVIGDPLQTGMDFQGKTESPKKTVALERAKNPDWLPPKAYQKHSKADNSDLAVQLPPNIQHRFGTNICKTVLCDKEKVDASLDRQHKLNATFHQQGSDRNSAFKLPPDPVDPLYDDLSRVVRQNVFPGYARDHRSSNSMSSYTKDVYDKRMKDTDKFRYQRHSLSTWYEQNVLTDRIAKAWREYDENKAVFAANWDRTAKREVKPMPPVEKPKPKPKPKPAPKIAKSEKVEKLPEVVFVTPPVTPPPPKDNFIPKKKYKRDDEFWNLYDKT